MEETENVKKAFQKVKEDMFYLQEQINGLKAYLNSINKKISELSSKKQIKEDFFSEKRENSNPTQKNHFSTIPTHNPTNKICLEALKRTNYGFSTGNEGVPTDKQTDKQTDKNENINKKTIENASKILNSLDDLKKDISLKFKNITNQELLVFSTIYQISEEGYVCTYKTLSKRLSLSESSIRDYVGRLIKKEIPIEKRKINNKNIQVSISPYLKKIASLPTILQLREL